MSNKNIWNYWARHYESLWVQKLSLQPTRRVVLEKIVETLNYEDKKSLIDIGCGVGELLSDISKLKNMNLELFGLDYADKMIECAKLKNPNVEFFCDDIEGFSRIEKNFSIITCTHSFPYYKNQEQILNDFHKKLNNEGKVIIGFASQNTWYDKVCLFFVKFTTGKAKYPSINKFNEMIKDIFLIEETIIIKEKNYMPSIVVFVLKKKEF